MSDERRRSSWIVVAAAAVLLPLLYVLSTGPIVWYESRHGPMPDVAQRTIEVVYEPIIWLMDEYEWAGAAAEWYFEFWER